ncbi:hypothetical protein [Amycolatopsis sp. NPDC051102]|uniref:hypothetical protein n=1 Tax=Amycolatopsis sp. NPDC051102 TaxID=3155163 RepID=UPI003447AB8D
MTAHGGRGLVAGVLAGLGVLAPVVGQVISDAMSFRTVQPAAVPFLLVALIAHGGTSRPR